MGIHDAQLLAVLVAPEADAPRLTSTWATPSQSRPRSRHVSRSPRIRSLSLAGNALGDAEITVLARSPHLARLRWLDLRRNRIGLPGLEVLVAALPDLVYVNLEDNDGYDSAAPLAEQLQASHGFRRWLRPGVRPAWPPDRDVS